MKLFLDLYGSVLYVATSLVAIRGKTIKMFFTLNYSHYLGCAADCWNLRKEIRRVREPIHNIGTEMIQQRLFIHCVFHLRHVR